MPLSFRRPSLPLLLLALSLYLPLAGQAKAEGTAADRASPLPTIGQLDVPRYLGRWYEIARLPNRFQQACVGQSEADYEQQADGSLRVTNRCPLASGEINQAVGLARQIGAADSPKLQVRFAPAWLSFIPAVWGNYWVVDLDPDYRWSIVSEPRREYLWLLAREPRLDAAPLSRLRQRLQALGFDPDALRYAQP
ncbi:lipocalin family protein [Dechloromonas sp. ZY10]|uniref:lipocalin family protein n=1 Tax=Dechloromonas aquae TaxID=2664436 RepID=UPI003526DBBE